MIAVHHLNNSRSQRILWLLEELGAPYEIKFHQRDALTRLAPPELKAIHPLGKSPVIVDDGKTIAESGAIVEWLCAKHGGARLARGPDSPQYADYLHWLHYAEGSAMTPLLLALYVGLLGEAGAPLRARIDSEIANHLGYMNAALGARDYLLGEFSAADIQNSFTLEAAGARLTDFPNLARALGVWQARPAYKRALDKGGPYVLMAR